ncbi:PEP-CTERM sorting domain-containing protein [Hydrocoleum sp. CS-953]
MKEKVPEPNSTVAIVGLAIALFKCKRRS